MSSRPIVVVTGANSGVGFGICHRLLFQLCQTTPSDSLPIFTSESGSDTQPPSISYDGLTLIMACRSTARAEAARQKLYRSLDAHVKKLKGLPNYDGHAETFCQNLTIDIQSLDLGSADSILQFGHEVLQKYPYVSRLIANAGIGSFKSLEYLVLIKQLCTSPLVAVTSPTYYLQHRGELSVDGFGWVWQCNVFGHYALFRLLQPLLEASPASLGARVIWTSSLEASPAFYDREDWQLIKTAHSYESSKYQIDLIASQLDRRALEGPLNGGSQPIRHLISQPGVVSTNISQALVGVVTNFLKLIIFYIVRFMGSPFHPITAFKSAVAVVHLSLVPSFYIPSPFATDSPALLQPVRFGSETDRWGEERVGLTDVKEWQSNEGESEVLVDRCEVLYQSLFKGKKNA